MAASPKEAGDGGKSLMGTVALVVHGVSNRDEAGFTRSVEELQRLGGSGMPELIPVFWGSLGREGPLLAIPGEEDVTTVPEAVGAFGAKPAADAVQAARDTADATVEELERRVGAVPPRTVAVLQKATREAAAAGWTLALQVDLAPVLADVVLAAPPLGSTDVQPRGAFGVDWVGDRVKQILAHAQDAIVDILVREFREREKGLGTTVAHTIGDVLGYETVGPAIRAKIDEKHRAAVARGDTVDILAHSLGALAAVEWLLGASVQGSATDPEKRTVRNLVTFGAQVSLFSELRGLRGVGDQVLVRAQPQSLPMRVERWSNVWQELDPLAFVMSHVFRIEVDGTVGAVEDLRLTQRGIPTNASFHSSYWRDERFTRWLARLLGG
ncbi:MAG: hypothetical protein LC799_27430 [Actinobacteria bacterium]|nr:hypothetical protein [Actinomycetota bacterium]